jgi:two-component system, NarL family, sensor kinase
MQGSEYLQAHLGASSFQDDSGCSSIYLQALIENSPIAIVVLDSFHRYALCNPAFQRLFKYSPEELAASTLDDLISTPRFAEEAARLTRLVMQGTHTHCVTQRRQKNGMIVDVEVYGVPLIVNGQVMGVYGLYQDITERNRSIHASRHISGKIDIIQQEERRRIARDLHDSTSQELAALNWNLNRLTRLVAGGEESLRELVEYSRQLAQECSEKIRSASYLLHPPFLYQADLASAIEDLSQGFQHRSGVDVELSLCGDLDSLPSEVEATFYRIVQEGLANTLRHSHSLRVRVSLQWHSNWLKLTMANEETGDHDKDSPGVPRRSTGTGIEGMRERLNQLGGALQVQHRKNGMTISASLPIDLERRRHHDTPHFDRRRP